MGEQPHPWVLLHTQDGKNRHRSSKPQGRYGLLPATTQLSPRKLFCHTIPTPRRIMVFVRPGFRLWISYYGKFSQAGFCPYTLRWISVPPEPTLGRAWYLFKPVPPQPNCPSTDVLFQVRNTVTRRWCLNSASTTPGDVITKPPTYTAYPGPSVNDRLQ